VMIKPDSQVSPDTLDSPGSFLYDVGI
jgi:hypothetical protein